jgi:hypothetical protein
MKRSRKIVFALKAAVSVFLIAYLLRRIGLGEAMVQASSLSLTAGAITVLIFWAYFLVAALRWSAILGGLGCSMAVGEAARITFVAAFFNQFLPATVGADAVRVWKAYRANIGGAAAIHSVVLERLANLALLAALAAVGATGAPGATVPKGVVDTLWALCIAVTALCGMLMLLDRLPSRMLPMVLRTGASQVAADSRRVFLNSTVMVKVVVTAIANQALIVAAVVVLADSLSVSISVLELTALLPAIMLISALPISIAGWGVREYAMVTGLGYAGVPAASALVISLALATLGVLSSVLGGAFWLLETRVRLHRQAH